jgi:glutaredoxin
MARFWRLGWGGKLRAALLLSVVGIVGACRSPAGTAPEQTAAAAEPAVPSGGLELRDSTADVLFTWIDEHGDFHVTEKMDEVPAEQRAVVRVVRTDGSGNSAAEVTVADLTQTDGTGRYPTRTLPRRDWDELGAARRAERLEALAPQAEQALKQVKADVAGPVTGPVQAVIYGADWCKPCHDAEKFLRGLGIPVEKKNIETSASARAEMQTKLQKIGRNDGSIPVIDVGGRVFVGFNPPALKEAVETARARAAQKAKTG